MNIRLRRAVHFFDTNALMGVRRSYPLTPDQEAQIRGRYASEIVESSKSRWVFLALDEAGMAVGYVQLLLKEADNDPELARPGEIAHIHDLRVRADWQGRGIGKFIMRELEAEARRSGMKELTLGVENHNTRAIKLYEGQGFSTFKVSAGRDENEWVFYMRKQISVQAAGPRPLPSESVAELSS